MDDKIKHSMKLVDADNVISGVNEMTEDICQSLQAIKRYKHPDAADADVRFLLDGDVSLVESVIFEEIIAQVIQAAAKPTSGSD